MAKAAKKAAKKGAPSEVALSSPVPVQAVAPAEPKKIGRPDEFTVEVGDKICSELIKGRSLRSITSDDDMPCLTTVVRWLRVHELFAAQYARAREDQADTLADEIIDIADDGDGDMTEDKDGELVVNTEHIQRSRLRVDARKWIAAKLKPKKYGDKLDVNNKGLPLMVIKDLSGD